jgi:hypothetical protein
MEKVRHSSFDNAADEARALVEGEETNFSVEDIEQVEHSSAYSVDSALVRDVVEDDGDLDGIAQEINDLAEQLGVPATNLFLKILELAQTIDFEKAQRAEVDASLN